MSENYWPAAKGSSDTYGKYTVTLTSRRSMTDYIVRKVDIISESQSRMSVPQTGFSVTHIQYLRWMEDGVPIITSPVLEIANLVQKVQMASGNKPIVVMCKYVIIIILYTCQVHLAHIIYQHECIITIHKPQLVLRTGYHKTSVLF